jgi:hypothetical protein
VLTLAEYLPTYCETCVRTSLSGLQAEGGTSCPRCGAPTTIVPGEIYHVHDLALFAQIEAEVHAARLSRQEARVLAGELTSVTRMASPERVLLRMLDFVPSLRFLLDDRTRLIRATGMFSTIVATQLRHLEKS